jgi:methyl-accepting chemotaxis protein
MIDWYYIASIVVSDKFTYVFCGILILVFFLFLIRFIYKLWPIGKTCIQLSDELGKLEDKESFAVEFRDFTDKMRKKKLLGQCWREFELTIVHQFPCPEQKPLIYSYEDAELYFNEQSVLASNLYYKFYNSLPNYLTGGGILGTFLGLAFGIYLASQGLSSENQDLLQEALRDLLDGASLAFVTSICGLLLSIIFSFFEKILLRKMKKDISRFSQELNKKIERINTVDLKIKQFDQLQKQTEHMESFVNDVAMNIADAMNDRLAKHLVPTLDKLSETIDGLRRDRGDSNERLVREMVDSFKDTMSSAAGNEISALGQSLKEMNQGLQPLLESTRHVLGEMQGAAQGMVEGVRKSYQESGDMFKATITESLDRMASSVEEGSNQMRQAAGGLAESFRQSCQEGGDTLTGQINSAVEVMNQSISRSGEQLQSMIENLIHELADSSTQSALSFKTTMSQTMSDYSSHISAAGQDMEERMRKVSSEVTDRLGGLVGVFEETIKKIESASVYQSEAMEEARQAMDSFKAVEQSLSSLVASSREASQKVKGSAEKLASAALQADSSLKQISQTSSSLNTAVGKTHNILEQLDSSWKMHLGQLESSWKNHLARFEGVDKTLEDVFDKLQKQWEAYAETTSDYSKKIQEYSSGITKNFSSVIEELRETIEEFSESKAKH